MQHLKVNFCSHCWFKFCIVSSGCFCAASHLRSMSPRARIEPSQGLGVLVPTKEELDAARTILESAGPKGKRSKMAAMSGWLVKHPEGEGHSDAQASRGESREQYLLRYMIWMQRRGASKICSTESSENIVAKTARYYWWTEWKARKELGDTKVDLWLGSGKLGQRPDPLTGSDKPEHKEYAIPVEWVDGTERTAEGTALTVEDKAQTQDFVNMRSLIDTNVMPNSTARSSQDGNAPPEQPEKKPEEAKTEADILQQRKAELVAKPSLHYKALTDLLVQSKEMKGACAALDDDLVESFTAALGKHIKDLEKGRNALDKMMNGEKLKASGDATMLKQIDTCKLRHDTLCEFGEKLGVQIGAKAPRSKPQSKRGRTS